MYYEINVAKLRTDGLQIGVKAFYEHFFATNKRSIATEDKLKKILKEFVVRFPEPEYDISVTLDKQETYGVDIEAIMKKEK